MHLAFPLQEYRFDGFSAEVNSCYYCGNPADTIDHVPPRAVRPMMLSDPNAFRQYKFYELDCCKECNSALNKKLWTPAERKAYIGKWLQKRYWKILAMPGWSEDELATMGRQMQVRIRANLCLRDVIKRRIRWASPKLSVVPRKNVKLTANAREQYELRPPRPVYPVVCQICGLAFEDVCPNRKVCSHSCRRIYSRINSWAYHKPELRLASFYEKRTLYEKTRQTTQDG